MASDMRGQGAVISDGLLKKIAILPLLPPSHTARPRRLAIAHFAFVYLLNTISRAAFICLPSRRLSLKMNFAAASIDFCPPRTADDAAFMSRRYEARLRSSAARPLASPIIRRGPHSALIDISRAFGAGWA